MLCTESSPLQEQPVFSLAEPPLPTWLKTSQLKRFPKPTMPLASLVVYKSLPILAHIFPPKQNWDKLTVVVIWRWSQENGWGEELSWREDGDNKEMWVLWTLWGFRGLSPALLRYWWAPPWRSSLCSKPSFSSVPSLRKQTGITLGLSKSPVPWPRVLCALDPSSPVCVVRVQQYV